MTDQQANRLVDRMNAYFQDSRVTVASGDVDRMRNHPKDRHVLAAAVECGAQIIVTFNLKHFRREALDRYKIKSRSPDGFLLSLLTLDSDRMLSILEEQIGDLHKPKVTIETVLENLVTQVPAFVAAVRKAL